MSARLEALRPFVLRMEAFRNHLLGGLGLGLATQLSGLTLLGLSGWFLTGCSLAGVSAVLAEAYDVISPAGGIRTLALSRTIGRWAERVVTHDATFRLIGALRVWLWDRLVLLSPRQLGSLHAGEMLGRLTKDIDALDNLYQKLLVPVAGGLLLTLIATIAAGVLSLSFSLPLALLVGLCFGLIPWLAWRSGRVLAPAQVVAQGRVRRVLLDTLDALDDLALHHPARQRQDDAVLRQDAQRLQLQARLHRLGFAFKALTGLAAGLAAWGVLGLAAILPAGWRVDGPLLVGLVLMIPGMAEALGALPAAWLELPGTAAAATRLTNLTGQQPAPAYPETSEQPVGHAVELAGIAFHYPGADEILSGFSLNLPFGRHLLLAGPSGGGKTTLARLLTRLEDPTRGVITLGGVPLSQLDETTLHRAIACTPQEPRLFTDTLAGNLRVADESATDEQLWAVLAQVGMDDAVRTWPQGLETWIAEGGESLSGGQRRRLGIALALLRQAPVTILDEPTEGLDDESAARLLRAVRRGLEGRTLLWVSHRPGDKTGFDDQLTLEPRPGL